MGSRQSSPHEHFQKRQVLPLRVQTGRPAVPHISGGTFQRLKTALSENVTELDFSSLATPSPWLAALCWMKNCFARQQPLAQRPLREIAENTIPERLRPYLLEFGPDSTPTGL